MHPILASNLDRKRGTWLANLQAGNFLDNCSLFEPEAEGAAAAGQRLVEKRKEEQAEA